MQENKLAVVWGRPECSYCDRAWDFLDSRGYTIDYRVIGEGYTKEQFLVENPGKRTVPQIYINNEYIGTYDDMMNYFVKNPE